MLRKKKIVPPGPGDMTVVGWAEQHTINCGCKSTVADHINAMIAVATLAGMVHEVFTVQQGPDGRHSIVFTMRSLPEWERFNTRVNVAAVLAMVGMEDL